MITMPVMVNPVKNLKTANMIKEEEKALANANPIPNIYDTISIGFRPNLIRNKHVHFSIKTKIYTHLMHLKNETTLVSFKFQKSY